MAEIHFSVSSDYKEVIRLRQEIEKLETQLKKMDVNKSPDIAKALESQLKSTYDQYKEIVSKIAESEAQIKLSSDNIIKNTKKIVEAQEKLSNATNTPSPSPGSTGPDTSGIQAQAKAYDELREQIDSVIGTRAQNIKRMVEEQNAIRLINAEMKKITRSQGESSSLSSAQTKRLEQLNNSLLTHKTALAEVRQNLSNNVKMDNAAATSMNGLSQSLSRMRVTYRELSEEERNSQFGKELLVSINQADSKIKALDATIGNHQRNVGNYASSWNGLNMSIQQIGRELPSLAYGPQVFFSAISNNLPILADEIKRAREEYKLLIAQGQKATPVWKQVVSSIFSWQTALTVGITLLTVYGKEIGNWVSNLFKGRDALKSVSEIQDDVSESIKESGTGIGEQITKLKKLQEAWTNLGANSEKRNEFIKKNKKEFDNLGVSVNNVYDAENLLIKNTSNFIEALKLRAKASAAQKLAAEQYELAIQKQIEAENEAKKGPSFGDIVKSGFVQSMTGAGGQSSNIKSELSSKDFQEERIKNIKKESKAAQELGDSYFKLGSELSGKASELLKSSGIKEATEEDTKYLKIREQIAEELYRLRLNNQQREIDLMKEGTEKKIAQINFDYKEQIEAIKKQADAWAKEQQGTLSAQQTMQISIAYSLAKKTRERDTTEVFQKQIEEENKAMNDYLKEYGDYQEKRLAITEEYNQKIAQATTEGEKLSLRKGLESAIKELDFSQFKTSINFADIFGNLDAQTTSSLTSLRDKLQEYINQAAKDLKPDDLKELQDAFSNINLKIADRQPFKELKSGLEDYKAAQEAVSLAQQDLDKVMSGGEVIVGLYSDETGQLVKKLLTQEQAEKNLSKAQSDRQKTLSTLNQSLNSIGDNGKKVVDGVNSLTGMLADLGVNVSEDVSKSVDGIGQVFEGLANIDLTKPGSIITSSMKIVGGLGKTIGGLFGGKSKAERDAERLAKVTDKIAQTNEIINNLIDKRVDLIKEATAAEREGLKESSLDIIERQRKMMEAQFQKLLGNELLGKKGKNNDLDVKDLGISSIEDLANFLTSDKLVELMENGYGITDKDKWYGIVEEWEKLNDQADKLKETVSEINTGITFDEARDGLDDLLLSADTTFRDISDNFEGYMRKSVLRMVKSNYLNDAMQKWYDQFEERTSDDVLSDEDINDLRQQYEEIYNKAQKEINDKLAAAGVGLEGASSSQESSKKGFATASQDQIEELNGRFTAGQIAWEETKNQAVMQTEKLSILNIKTESLVNVASDQRNIADETRTILANSYLELQQINENTGAIIKPITEMRDKMNSWDSKIRNM